MGICYLLSAVLTFVDKCSKSKVCKASRFQQTPRVKLFEADELL